MSKTAFREIPEKQSPMPRTYGELRRRITEILVCGRAELEALKLDIYWRTGRLLASFLDRAEVRNEETVTVERLACDLDLAPSLLYRLLQFARAYPRKPISPLTWSHIKELLTVQDKIKRKRIAAQALSQNWNVRRLRLQIQKARAPKPLRSGTNGTLQEPTRHTPGIRRVKFLEVARGTREFVVDLGFDLYEPLENPAGPFKNRQTVRWNPERKAWARAGNREELYYYRARIERVVDGDTLLTHIFVHNRLLRRQYLRLRGLDAEPLDTVVGRRAREWLARTLEDTEEIRIRTSLTDRYDRYIADVWGDGLYLNRALLEAGLARRINY